jgi:Tol biopolymer transport system component
LIVTTVAIPGTDGATQPFWSPDSQSLGFFADNELKIVEIRGGQPHSLAPIIEARGGSWGQGDLIVFGPDRAGPLYQVSAKSGGTQPATVIGSSPAQTSHRWPYFLPDGRHFVYFARSADVSATGVYVAAVGEPSGKFLVRSSSDAVFAPPGFLLFVRDESLMAQAFDVAGLKMIGEPVSVVPKVGFALALNRGTFSVSNTGVLVYGAKSDNRPVWFDRAHKELDAIAGPANYTNLSLAHNGRIATVEQPDPGTGNNDVHVIEIDRGAISSRFTTNPNSDVRVVWTPDDTRLVWASNRTSKYDLYAKSLIGGEEELLLKSEDSKNPTDISADGRFLFYESGSVSKTSLMVLPLAGEKQPFPLLGTGFNEAQARMSPDSRWISYTTDKDGSDQVYVIEAAAVLPPPGQSVVAARPRDASSGRRISPNGGTQALWRLDGKRKELYYLSPERGLMVVPFTEAGPGLPVELFKIDAVETNRTGQSYAPSRDGQRFLILTPVAESSPPAVVFNWAEALKRSR